MISRCWHTACGKTRVASLVMTRTIGWLRNSSFGTQVIPFLEKGRLKNQSIARRVACEIGKRSSANHWWSWVPQTSKLQCKGPEVIMPLYEYYCQDCENQFSEVLTVKEHKKKKIHCPKCKRANVKEVIERSLPLGSEQRGPGRSGGL